MIMRIRWLSGAALGVALLALTTTAQAQTAPPPAAAPAATPPPAAAPPPGVAATVGSDAISMAIWSRASPSIWPASTSSGRACSSGSSTSSSATSSSPRKRRGAVSAWTSWSRTNEDKTPAVTQAEVNTFIAQNRARLPKADETDLRQRVAQYLEQQHASQQRESFIAGLRAGAQVRVYLKEAEPVRVKVDPSVGPALGSPQAPVTIVEFSDFQCPFCRSVVPTLKQLLAKYPDRVRLVFRDFPIPSLHPDAPLAHEAARCAAEQGQFWAYHDLLFERTNLNAAALKQYAADLKLDEKKFAECLDSGRSRAAVSADVEEGSRLGVSGTPTFFINGTPLVGNVPAADFQRAIERELARTASTK